MTTNPHIKAGGLPPTELHRPVVCKDGHGIRWNAEPEPDEVVTDAPRKYADRPMPYTDLEMIGKDGPEKMIAALIVLVLFIGLLAIWWTV